MRRRHKLARDWHPDARAALEALQDRVRSGEISSTSREYYSLRDQARNLDPSWVEYQKQRARDRYQRILAGRPAREPRAPREPKPKQPTPSIKSTMQARIAKRLHPTALIRMQLEAEATAREIAVRIEAADDRCRQWVMDGAYRIRCGLSVPHEVCWFRRTVG